jgi:hypothetical protein
MPLYTFFYTICWMYWYRLKIKSDYKKNSSDRDSTLSCCRCCSLSSHWLFLCRVHREIASARYTTPNKRTYKISTSSPMREILSTDSQALPRYFSTTSIIYRFITLLKLPSRDSNSDLLVIQALASCCTNCNFCSFKHYLRWSKYSN